MSDFKLDINILLNHIYDKISVTKLNNMDKIILLQSMDEIVRDKDIIIIRNNLIFGTIKIKYLIIVLLYYLMKLKRKQFVTLLYSITRKIFAPNASRYDLINVHLLFIDLNIIFNKYVNYYSLDYIRKSNHIINDKIRDIHTLSVKNFIFDNKEYKNDELMILIEKYIIFRNMNAIYPESMNIMKYSINTVLGGLYRLTFVVLYNELI